ncbi:hypothetical protein BGW36DRAFT_378774 [Talaromyces proteolyticus]|uniref:Uncharacterized protein n=1 Tax=Talaromyces proteolyticus TaxID=1131652 RepID=A0AAD4KR58_9EURO|nr:uncharacterized protein BGW36DRAFT_378774 [Talaromyces proteolyticus]KAH8697475.1 hypothetical protein BGW36DRAFT_378774 [Talaromyces proteolyticus]
MPEIASVSDEECPSLFSRLLSPALGLKEARLRVSGVVHMIEPLEESVISELRTYLVSNIEQRVKSVLGTEEDLQVFWIRMKMMTVWRTPNRPQHGYTRI